MTQNATLRREYKELKESNRLGAEGIFIDRMKEVIDEFKKATVLFNAARENRKMSDSLESDFKRNIDLLEAIVVEITWMHDVICCKTGRVMIECLGARDDELAWFRGMYHGLLERINNIAAPGVSVEEICADINKQVVELQLRRQSSTPVVYTEDEPFKMGHGKSIVIPFQNLQLISMPEEPSVSPSRSYEPIGEPAVPSSSSSEPSPSSCGNSVEIVIENDSDVEGCYVVDN